MADYSPQQDVNGTTSGWHDAYRIAVPALIAILLFIIALFSVFLPAYEDGLWNKRREGVKELVYSAWSTLEYYHSLERDGVLTRDEAQHRAIEHFKFIRYGSDFKDYFWINDTRPYMIMHPYRIDLDNTSLENFTDPTGFLVFVEMMNVVNESGEGFVQYMWQWKDDPHRIEPKLSFVKLYEPWKWIIGSGMYINDVHDEISGLKRRLLLTLASIMLLIFMLSAYLVRENLVTSRKRIAAEMKLRHSEMRFRELAELLPEIVFEMNTDGVLTFVNDHAYDMTGYVRGSLENNYSLIDIIDYQDRERVARNIRYLMMGEDPETAEYSILCEDGTTFPALIRTIPIVRNEKTVGLRGILINISETKKAQQELRESEEKYRTLFEAESDAILLIDADEDLGRIIDCNKAAIELYGYSREEIRTMTVSELSMDPEKTMQAIRYHVRFIPKRFHRKKDGSIFTIEAATNYYTWRGKEIIVAAIRDISDRVKAHEELEEQRTFFENVINNAPNSIYVLDKEAGIVLANRVCCRMLNCMENELIGKRFDDFLTDTSVLSMMGDDDAAIFLDGRGRVEREHPFVDGHGVERWLYTVKVPMKGLSREVTRLVGISSDITDLKAAEAALRKSEENFRAVFETAQDSIFIKDKTLHYINANPAFTQLCRMSADAIIGRTDIDLFNEKNAGHIREMDRRVLSGETVQEETTLQLHGEEFILNLIKVPMRNKSGDIVGLCGIARDITQQKKIENQFQQSQKLESIGRLAGGIAHDFNNLLTVITGNADLAMLTLPEDHQVMEEIREIKLNAERAANLTRQLLAFSRRQVVAPRVVNINAIIKDMDKLFRRLIGENIELVTLIKDDLWNVLVDPGQVEQVLTNLVVNARDAIESETGTITIETGNVMLDEEYAASHTDSMPGEHVMFAVSDNGCGMNEETRALIFEPFFTTKELGKGTGLGLATCYGIVKQNKGSIWVYSELGKGTTFKVYLPRTLRDTDRRETSSALAQMAGGSETVLLVEDEFSVSDLSTKVLTGKGYTVVNASNGEEALHVLEHYTGDPFSLLITDVVMPHMGGVELAEKISTRYPAVKVLFMSGYTDASIVSHGFLKPDVAFIQKPFTPAALVEKVREVLDSG